MCVCLLMCHCSTAHTLLLVVCYMKQKHKLSKCVIASFFWFQVEVCCEQAITFVSKIIWRSHSLANHGLQI